MSAAPAGTLVLVVGPSGAGKDSILDGARRELAKDPRFVFARREITRPPQEGDEDHVPVSRKDFAERSRAGAYALSWEAHGNGYGIPATIAESLARGRVVIANVSRGIIPEARARFSPLRIVNVTVPPAVLAERLRARGRESAAQIESRLERAAAYRVSGEDVVTLSNDGSLDDSVRAFVSQLLTLAVPSE